MLLLALVPILFDKVPGRGRWLWFSAAYPVIAYFLVRWFAGIDQINGAAVAAHYGSVSAVTFLAAIEATRIAGLEAGGYMAALVAVLEVPGIIVGLVLARR